MLTLLDASFLNFALYSHFITLFTKVVLTFPDESLQRTNGKPGLPDPQKPSLPLQPKTTATLGPFTATKSFVTATFTATFGAENGWAPRSFPF